jgi:energy-coupling factor transporter ATP-binding protein EcfA2
MRDYKTVDKTEWFIRQMKSGWLSRREIVEIAATDFPSTPVKTLDGTIGQYWSDSVNPKWGTYKAIQARGLKVVENAGKRRIVEGRSDGPREMWNSNDPTLWKRALNRYWEFVKPSNLALEKEMDQLDAETVRAMNPEAWYVFLLEKYFRWKYTAPNRYASTSKVLRTYEANSELALLHAIKDQLFALDKDNIQQCLALASSIRGLGTAGASGLLAVLFPTHFGTVDQFAVNALAKIPELPERDLIAAMSPMSLKLSEGATLIRIMRRKAAELNSAFSTSVWTPRKVDMVLWTCGRYVELGEEQQRALGEIKSALSEGAVVNLVGPKGTGKTTVLLSLRERLTDANFVAIGLGTLERGALVSRLRQELSSWQGREGRLVLLLDDWDCAANVVDEQEVADFQRLLYFVVSRGPGSGVVFVSQRPLAELQADWSREILALSAVGATNTVTLESPAMREREPEGSMRASIRNRLTHDPTIDFSTPVAELRASPELAELTNESGDLERSSHLLKWRLASGDWERFLRELAARVSWLGDECRALGFDIEHDRDQFGAFLIRANLPPEEFVGKLLRPSDVRGLFPDLGHFHEKSAAVSEAFKQWKAQEDRP